MCHLECIFYERKKYVKFVLWLFIEVGKSLLRKEIFIKINAEKIEVQNVIYLKEKQNDIGWVVRKNTLNAKKCKSFMLTSVISFIYDLLALLVKINH